MAAKLLIAAGVVCILLPTQATTAQPDINNRCLLAAERTLHSIPDMLIINSKVAVAPPDPRSSDSIKWRKVMIKFRAAGVTDTWMFLCASAQGGTFVQRLDE